MSAVHAAARNAMRVLREVQKTDADNGVTDPDVDEAIELLRSSLQHSRTRWCIDSHGLMPSRPNKFGFAPLEELLVNGGPMKGKTVRFLGAATGGDVYVASDIGRRIVRAKLLERVQP